jgi:hypothetical protein
LNVGVKTFGELVDCYAPRDRAELAAYAAAGVTRVCFSLPSGGRDELLGELDRLAPLVAGVTA